ncbi:hypothetical protein HK102_010835 [Quaeritorhiza haematococci]|nr:hypothetical protein HK102_010835 [Quaeritorhiza haematococci]
MLPLARTTTRLATPAARLALQRRAASGTSVFAPSHLAKFFPQVELKGTTTLGEVWDAVFAKYKYRMVYPVLAWVGFCYWAMWTPYQDPVERKKIQARMEKLKNMEYHQE